MRKVYYELIGDNEYKPLKSFDGNEIGVDEWYARQLCFYHIINGFQYEQIAIEMTDSEEQIIVSRIGEDGGHDESGPIFATGIFVEFRNSDESTNYQYLNRYVLETHYEVLKYLTKDVVYVPSFGQKLVTSREIDETRGGYVIYTKDI